MVVIKSYYLFCKFGKFHLPALLLKADLIFYPHLVFTFVREDVLIFFSCRAVCPLRVKTLPAVLTAAHGIQPSTHADVSFKEHTGTIVSSGEVCRLIFRSF